MTTPHAPHDTSWRETTAIVSPRKHTQGERAYREQRRLTQRAERDARTQAAREAELAANYGRS